MLKGMDPEGLAEMMKQSGMNVTPEQARTMVDKLDGVSGGWVGGWVGGAGAGGWMDGCSGCSVWWWDTAANRCPACLHWVQRAFA